jgi:tetratricopeptide (TPR) repeat protein
MATDPFGWVGATIEGRYVVERVVGEGGQGIVYRGMHLGFDEPIAIKCLKVAGAVTTQRREGVVDDFRSEARLLHRLSRRTTGIVQALDVGAATAPSGDWTPYIVMEWLQGKSLREEIADRGREGRDRAALPEAARLLAPAVAALETCHAEGVAHLDVKPANLFLLQGAAGTAPAIKLLDFGIAKVLGDNDALTSWSGAGIELPNFTPHYAAPEQFHPRHGPTGPWTDVFALALVLLELASGRRVLAGARVVDLYDAAADEAVRPSLASLGVMASEPVEAAVRTALSVDPRRRHRTAGAFWRALEDALRHDPRDAETLVPRSAATRRSDGTDGVAGTAPAAGCERRGDAPSGASAPEPLEENRICTIALIGLRPREELPDAEAAEMVARHQDELARSMRESGGHADVTGDSLLVVFGLRRGDGAVAVNDAEQAVRAVLGARDHLDATASQARGRRGPRLALCAGLHTGRVFVRHAPGAETSARLTVIGQPVSFAGRFRDGARDGEILIGRDTHRQVAGLFEAEPVALRVSGAEGRALVAYRVLGGRPRSRPLAAPLFHGRPTRFVGRGAETARLAELCDAAHGERRACLVTLVGAAGIGKTRLLTELSAAAPEGAVVLSAQCQPRQGQLGEGIVVALLRGFFLVHDDDPGDVVARKLRAGIERLRAGSTPAGLSGLLGADVEDLAAQLGRLFGARVGGDAAPMTPDEHGARARERIAAATAELLRLAPGPVSILCDDVHWADDASLDLLAELVVRLHDAPLFVAVTAQESLYERRPHWGEGRSDHQRVDLGPLPRRHLEEMARDLLARLEPADDALVRRLGEHAEGSPHALEETVHLLVDAGAIEIGAEAPDGAAPWRAHGERLRELALPTSVQGLAQARLDRLRERERQTLMLAAVAGRTFWDGLLEVMAARAPGLGESASEARSFEQTLATLRARGFLQLRETSSYPEEREYVFADAAVHQVAYATLSKKVRRPLHLVVARWLEERTRSDAARGVIGRHYERAGEIGHAVRAFVRAAAHAAALGNNGEALRAYQQAWRLDAWSAGVVGAEGETLEGLVASDEGRVLDWQARVELRLALGDVQRRLGRFDDAEKSYGFAREGILRTERRTGGALDPSEARRADARVDYRLALVKQLRGDLEPAARYVERAIEAVTEAGAVDETPLMWAALADIERRRRDRGACVASVRRGLRACRGLERAGRRWREGVARLLNTLGGLYYGERRAVRAERCFRQALRTIDAREDPHAASLALNNLAAVRSYRGDAAGARALFLEVLRLCSRSGDLAQTVAALSNLAEVEVRMGEARLGYEHAREAVRLGEELGLGRDLAEAWRNLAEAALALGETAEASEAAARVLGYALRPEARIYLAGALETAARVVEGCPAGEAKRALADALPAVESDEGLAALVARCRRVLA